MRKRIVILLSTTAVLPLHWSIAQAPRTPVGAPLAPNAMQIGYVNRVRQIEGDLRWSVATLWMSFEQMQSIQSEIDRPKRSSDVTALGKQRDVLKIEMIRVIKKVQSNALRLRSLPMIPRSWKRMDDRLIDASFDFERGAEGINTWLVYPADEVRNAASKLLRHGQSTLDDVTRDLSRRTGREMTAKKYF